jgi:cytoskeletal protein RodZ
MADDDVRPLGAALTAAREERGLSIEDVAAATRIRPAILRSIERDDFGPCGGDAYARGHLRSIAQVVGTDPRPLVEEFDRRFDRLVPSLTTTALPAFDPPRDAGRSGRQSPSWASVAVGALAVVVVFLVVSWVVRRDGGPPPVGAAPAPATSSATAGPAPRSPSARPPRSPAPPRVRGVVLRLRASGGSSWVSVTGSDGSQLYQGILADGQAREFRDSRQLSVRFGNSPAVRVTQNGRDVGPPRCQTEVCTVAFGPAAAG